MVQPKGHWEPRNYATASHKMFETNSSFHVKQRTTRKVEFVFFLKFFASINKIFQFGGETGH